MTVAETQAELYARAEAAGIEIDHRSCPSCGAARVFGWPDPVDLARYRRSRGWTLTGFAKRVRKPDGKKVTIGFVCMVEQPERGSRDSRRCPDWLLQAYLDLPQRDPIEQAAAEEGRSPENLERLRKATVTSVSRAYERRAKERAEAGLTAPRKGSLWRKRDQPDKVIEIVGVALPSILWIPQAREDLAPKTMRISTLHKQYKEAA